MHFLSKEKIINKIKNSQLDLSKIIVISGASLVLHDVNKFTADIDLACDEDYYNSIEWPVKIGAFGKLIKYDDVFEISNNLFKECKNNIDDLNGLKCANLKICLEIKEKLNRKKDKKHIKKLKGILN